MAIDLITAVPTPFNDDESLDLAGTERLFADIASRPIDAALVAGTTGEFTALTRDERLAVLKAGLDAFGPDRAMLHVGDATAREAVALTEAAAGFGGRSLVAITPYYFPAPADAVVEYYRRLCEAAGDARIYAYLFHARTTTVVAPDLLTQLRDVGVTGVKISGESDDVVAAYLAAAPEGLEVYSGNDVSFAAFVAAGGLGVISGVSSVFPDPFLGLRDALREGDTEKVEALQPLIGQLVSAVNAGGIRQLKAGLELRGVPGGTTRSAVSALLPEEREAIQRALEEARL